MSWSDNLPENPRVLVTGASGFVGAALCALLVERNWRVVAGCGRQGGQQVFPQIELQYLPLSRERDRWRRALRSVDCVVHLAACVHRMRPDERSQSEFHQINVEGSRFVAEECARAGVGRLVFLSSAKVNGEGNEARAYGSEDAPDPRDAYARSKLAAEIALEEVCHRTGMEIVIIRPPLVYGPGVKANFQRLLRMCEIGIPLPLASVNNRRSLIGVENLADFIETSMRHAHAPARVWLVSDGEDISTPALIRRLARAMGRPARLFSCPPRLLRAAGRLLGRDDEMSRLCGSFILDTGPARELLRWRAPLTVDQGLERTAMAYLEQREILR